MQDLKHFIFGILLFICFSMYAVSPIYYAYHDKECPKNRHSTHQESSVLCSVKLVLLSLLFADIHEREPQETSSAEGFLIKTGKALTEGKADIQRTKTSEIAVFVHDLTPSSSGKHVYIQSSLSKPYRDSLAFFTGLSPPQFNS